MAGKKTKLFAVLFTAGMAGVLSLLAIDLNALVQALPIASAEKPPQITPLLKVLSLIQPAVLVAVAVFVGTTLAGRVGLHAPATEAAVNGSGFTRALKPQLMPGLVGGLVGGLLIVVISRIALPFLPDGAPQTISTFVGLMPLITRVGYGGIVEELLLRWGFLTLLVWIFWRLFQKREASPKSSAHIIAILASSILFGIGHLPITYLLFGQPTTSLIVFVIAANSIFGIIAGTLFWKKGLESSILAHAVTHLVLLSATAVGAYF